MVFGIRIRPELSVILSYASGTEIRTISIRRILIQFCVTDSCPKWFWCDHWIYHLIFIRKRVLDCWQVGIFQSKRPIRHSICHLSRYVYMYMFEQLCEHVKSEKVEKWSIDQRHCDEEKWPTYIAKVRLASKRDVCSTYRASTLAHLHENIDNVRRRRGFHCCSMLPGGLLFNFHKYELRLKRSAVTYTYMVVHFAYRTTFTCVCWVC